MNEERVGGRKREKGEDSEDLGVRGREGGDSEGGQACGRHDRGGERADGGRAVESAGVVKEAAGAIAVSEYEGTGWRE